MKYHDPHDHSHEAWVIDVKRTHPDALRGAGGKIVLGLSTLEYQARVGFGSRIDAPHRDLAESLGMDKGSVGKALKALDGVALEVVPGKPFLGSDATSFRRLTTDELHDPKSHSALALPRAATHDGDAVADAMNARVFYWLGYSVTPRFEASKTGRVYSKRPNVQGEHGRAEGRLKAASDPTLPAGWSPFEVDFRCAEPMVLKEALRREALRRGDKALRWPDDPYQALASVMGMQRKECGVKFNEIIYNHGSRAACRSIAPAALAGDGFFTQLVGEVDGLKERLRIEGKPVGKGRRFVETLAGRRIEATRGGRTPHNGTLLNWVIQGTVADILNAATLRLLKLEGGAAGFRILFPVHDSLLCVGATKGRECVSETMKACAAKVAGVKLETKVAPSEKETD